MKFADEDVSEPNIKPRNDVYNKSITRRLTDSIMSKINPGVTSGPQIAFEAESIYEDASGLNKTSQDDVYSGVEPYQIKSQMLEKAEPHYE